MIGRESEFKIIKMAIENFIKFKVGNILYISGVPGSGKTHCINSILEVLKNEMLEVSFINCSKLNSFNLIYKKILENYNCKINKPYNLQSLRLHSIKCSKLHLIIIDEIDFIRNESILYNLFDLPYLESSNLMMILLSNTLGQLSSKVESRIGKNRIEFQPYTVKEIKEILKEENFKLNGKEQEDADCDKLLDFISKKVSSSTGDIRKAKDLFHKDLQNLKEVNKRIKNYFEPIIEKFVKHLNFYQNVILKNLIDQQKISILDLFNNFKSYCKINSIAEIKFYDFRDVLEDLENFGLIKIKNKKIIINRFLKDEIKIIQ